MIRRSPIETKINHERWLVSYADFITLLFAFFVVMYSVSQVNESKYRTLSDSLHAVFDPQMKRLDAEREEDLSFELGHLESILTELDSKALDMVEGSAIKTLGNEQWVEIELDANVLFVSGSAKLNLAADDVLVAVSESLLGRENAVSVEGHTDNIPIDNAQFENNWQLSAARSVSVLNFLAFHGVEPRRLSAVGFGEYRPIADNSTAQGRKRNRRVIIRVASHSVPLIDVETSPSVVNSQSDDDIDTSAQAASLRESHSSVLPEGLTPVRLDGGGILFSSDPNLPRTNAPAQLPSTPDE